jgi:AcrR family transcriptional regulator
MRDGQATRQRILEAATAEFAARGIAGARVDRIAAAARTNKAQMYAYFGSKDGLFDAVFQLHLSAILDAVPLDAEDLPGYAVRVYDNHLEHPDFVRLAGWSRLERIPSGDLIPDPEGHARKVQAIAAAQATGHIDPALIPGDVLAIVIAVAMTWSPLSIVHTTQPAAPRKTHDAHRTMIRTTVRRLLSTN